MTDHPVFERPFDLNGLNTYDLDSRPSKVFHDDLGRPLPPGASVEDWIDSLPRQLAGNSLRRVRFHLARAHAAGNTVVLVEHDLDAIASADWVIDLGPGGGDAGGEVVAVGPPANVARSSASATAPYLARRLAAV